MSQQPEQDMSFLEAGLGVRERAKHASSLPQEENSERTSCHRRTFRWYTLPRHLGEYIFSVDLCREHRRHLVWSKRNCPDVLLRDTTSRFSTASVFLSLMLATSIGTLYSPSGIMTDVRKTLDLSNDEWQPSEYPYLYAAGFILCMTISFNIAALLANFTAWKNFSVVSPTNAAVILGSEIGLYASHLPAYLTVGTIYLFVVWVLLLWIDMMGGLNAASATMLGLTLALIGHVVSIYSATGRIIMSTCAMKSDPVLEGENARNLTPQQLDDLLVAATRDKYRNNSTCFYCCSRGREEINRGADEV